MTHPELWLIYPIRSNDTLPLDPKNTGIDRKSNQGRTGSADDLRLLHHRAKEAQNRKARALRELEENHPFFDRPLFILKRNGKIRKFCKMIVSAQYGNSRTSSGNSGSGYFSTGGREGIKMFYIDLLSLLPYIDWIMLVVTLVSASFMLTENHYNRLTGKHGDITFIKCL